MQQSACHNALPKKFKIYKRDYSNLDETALIDEIQSVNWETIFPHDCDVNIIFDRFYSTIADIIDKHVPVKKLSKKQIKFYSKPWITPGIKTSIKTKNKLFKKYLNNKSPDYSHNYKLYRNKLTNLLRVSKEKYFNSYFIKHSKDVKAIWRGIKDLITLKPKHSNAPSKLIRNSREIVDAQEIAKTFNEYFSNIGNRLAS